MNGVTSRYTVRIASQRYVVQGLTAGGLKE